MQYKLKFPLAIRTSIQLPYSKSISNRVLIVNALAGQAFSPNRLSDCDDTRVTIAALNSDNNTIDIGAAGTAMRFLTAYFAVTPGTRVLTGSERMRQRPIHLLVDALRELGADIEYLEHEGYPPLRIVGKELSGQSIGLRGNVSSQYISALLMIAPTLKNGLRIQLTDDRVSTPYIYMTLHLMKAFGVDAVWESENNLYIPHQPYINIPFTVESDWSAASYWYQMVALSKIAEIRLPGLFDSSYQGDRRGADIFAGLGVHTTFTQQGAVLTKQPPTINRLEEDFTDIPDLTQTLVVTCALLGVPFHFTGLQTLIIKETNRIDALIAEMAKLGYVIRQENHSELIWDGKRINPKYIPIIKTYKDHRMAMAFAPAAIHYPQLIINDPQVVSKSYPTFWENLIEAGVGIQLMK